MVVVILVVASCGSGDLSGIVLCGGGDPSSSVVW